MQSNLTSQIYIIRDNSGELCEASSTICLYIQWLNWLSAFFIICQIQICNWRGFGLSTLLFDELFFWQMKGKHFLKSYYQSLRTVSVSWWQTVLRTVTCHTRVTKCSPSVNPNHVGCKGTVVALCNKFPDRAQQSHCRLGTFGVMRKVGERQPMAEPWETCEEEWKSGSIDVRGWAMWGNRLSSRRAGEQKAMREQSGGGKRQGKKENCKIS